MPDQIQYSHDVKKLPDAGLQLNLPPDLVPGGQYSIFSNAISRIEGQVQTRDGVELVCAVGASGEPVHSIFRLNQASLAINGERLFGIASELWSAPLPDGDVPAQLTQYTVAGILYPSFRVSFDGTPLSMMPFRFDADPQAWAIIANPSKMMKRKQNYYEQLGLPAPTVEASASVDTAGNLDGDYDWRYTYVNEVTNTESNPSPEMATSATEVLTPSAFTAPAPGVGGDPAQTVTNTSVAMSTGNAGGEVLVSAVWAPWNSPAGDQYTALKLQLTIGITTSIQMPAGVTGVILIEYSLDGGSNWNTAWTLSVTGPPTAIPGITPIIIDLPASQDFSMLQLRATCSQSAATSPVFGVTLVFTDLQTVGTLTSSVPAPVTMTNDSANVCALAPVDPQETAIRLYRRGGTLTDNWYFVGQYPIGSLVQGGCGAGYLEINDNRSDASISANPTLELDNDMPVSSVQVQNQTLKAIWGFDERVLGVGDPARPESVYFSKRGNADSWPPQNWVPVSEPGTEMMNGFSWNLRCWAFSRERLYTLVLNVIQGVTFTPQGTSCLRGLKGRWAFCIGEKGIYFISKDGPFRTTGGPEENIADDSIRPLFPTFDNPVGVDTNGYEAIDMDDEDGLRLTRHNSEIWFDYTGATSGTRQTIIYDERRNRWRGYFSDADVLTSLAQTHYSEPETTSRLLTGKVSGSVLQSQGAVSDESDIIEVQVRTGSFDQGIPLNLKEYGDVIFDIDPGGADVANPVTITPYLNGNSVPQSAITVTGTGRQRVALSLDDAYGLNVSFLVEWNTTGGIAPVLYQLDILYRVEPAAVKHFEFPPNSFGMHGWFHIRDAYVVVRSAADVTMTLTLDNGAVQTYTLPSTSGNKRKLYVPFAANKVKLAGFAFDSDGDFRLYSPETEVRIKQWLTGLGYQSLPILGVEQ